MSKLNSGEELLHGGTTMSSLPDFDKKKKPFSVEEKGWKIFILETFIVRLSSGFYSFVIQRHTDCHSRPMLCW